MWKFQQKYPFFSQKQVIAAGLFCLFLSVLGGTFIFNSIKFANAKNQDSSQKIITVFEGENRRSFISRAKTVGEALQGEGITIAAEDNVEPELDEKLTGTDYNVNIFRAKPFLIADGERKIRVVTAASTPKKIAQKAGITLLERDIIQFSESKTLLDDGSSGILEVVRAKEIKVKLFGQDKIIRTQAKTVAEFLKENKIEESADLWTSKSLTENLASGDNLEIAKNGIQTISQDEEVAFAVEQIQDGEKEIGYKQVKEAGEKGAKTVIYEVNFQNGKEVSRKKISEVETKKPKKQVEVVGAKVRVIVPSEHRSLMLQAGIPEADLESAEWLIAKESGWRVNAANRSSGAYGLPQALPGTKMASAGADWQTNPVTQLRWMNGYVIGRYKSWSNAVAHSKSRGWY